MGLSLVWGFNVSLGQEFNLTIEDHAPNQRSLRIAGEHSGELIVEVADDLTDPFWQELARGDLAGGDLIVEDGEAFNFLDGVVRYYRVRAVSIHASQREVLVGDTIRLSIEESNLDVSWEWSVNSESGGSDSWGTIQGIAGDPQSVLYTAPLIAPAEPVLIRATNPNDPTHVFEIAITVHGASGEWVVRPEGLDIPVNRSVTFQAGMLVDGVGFVPRRDVVWKMNGETSILPEFGQLDPSGEYQAPWRLPNLPVGLEIGFSLTDEANMIASTPMRIVDFKLNPPKEIVDFNFGEYRLLAQLFYSDGSVEPLLSGQVAWSSTNEDIAQVSGDGVLKFWFNDGVALIRAQALGLPLEDTIRARNRLGVYVYRPDVIPLPGYEDHVSYTGENRGEGIIEVTQPGVRFVIDPQLYSRRGPIPAGGVPNELTSALGSDTITFRGDDDFISVRTATSGVPQLSSVTAVIRDEEGLVEVGQVPGDGRFTIAYADEEFAHEKEFTLRYTRLGFDVSVIPNASGVGDLSQAYVSAPIDFELSVWNPRSDSQFVGKTAFQVNLADGSPILAELEDIVIQGDLGEREAPIRAQGKHLIDTDQLTGFFARTPAFGQSKQTIHLRVYPRREGRHEFQFSIPNDPGITPIKVELDVQLPNLSLGRPGQDMAPVVDGGLILPVNAYLPILENDIEPRLLDLNPFAQRGWELKGQRPAIGGDDGIFLQQGLGYLTDEFGRTGGLFTGTFGRKGDYVFELSLKGSPTLKSHPLPVRVIDPAELTNWPPLNAENNPHINASRVKRQLPPRLVVGGYKILSVTPEFAKPGERIRVRLQTFNGLGEAKPVGYTKLSGSKPDDVRAATFVVAPFIDTASLLGFTDLTFPETYESASGGSLPLYVDENGISVVEMTVPQNASGLRGNVGLPLYPYSKGGSLWDTRATSFAGQDKFTFEHPNNVFDETEGNTLEFQPPNFSLTAWYEDPNWNTLSTHETRIFGNGVYLVPNVVPVVSPRVREKVKQKLLPEQSDLVQVTLRGVGRFASALESGITSADFGTGVSVESSVVSPDNAVFRLSTDPAQFGNNDSLGVPRQVKFVFGDGTEATTEFRLFQMTVEPRNALGNVDLPLNAQYGLHDAEIGFRSYRMQPGMMLLDLKQVPSSFELPGGPPEVGLELIPSIHAAWDANQNGKADADEDRNNDKVFDYRDAPEDATRFRGQVASNPLVGFERQFDKAGNPVVRSLSRRYVPGSPSLIRLYGNTEDRRRVDMDLKLGEPGDPDGLPDFVSTKTDGERLLVRAFGTIVDCMDFTAFNINATPKSKTQDPAIGFEGIKAKPDVTFETYSRFRASGSQQALSERRSSENTSVSVLVDHESDARSIVTKTEVGEVLASILPQGFSAGLVDQYYMARVGRGGFTHLGRDERVRAYEPDASRVVTGTRRYPFGVELDGIIFDANSSSLHLDNLPNSPRLLGIPIVESLFSSYGGELTNKGLFPSVGPRSGGFVDLSARASPSFYFEAKSPVAEFPGLHGGYLVEGTPANLVDPRTSSREDDIEDVSLMRNLRLSSKPIVENRFAGTPRKRNVLVYGSALDGKEPIQTAVRADAEFMIGFDPADYAPGNPEQFKIKATLNIQEIVEDDAQPIALIATTQSDGGEATAVRLTDAALDLTIDVTTSALLGVMTGGSYLQACGGVSGTQVISAAIGLTAGFIDQEVYGKDPRNSGPSAYVMPLVTGGVSAAPGVKIPNAFDLAVAKVKGTEELPRGRQFQFHKKNVINNGSLVSHCSLFSKPITELKNELKSNYSVRSFGGGGSAVATGSRVLAVCIDKQDQLDSKGIYAAHVNLHRKADVIPNERFAVRLSTLPWKKVWDAYPYPDLTTDQQLVHELYAALDVEEKRKAAEQILRKVQVSGIIREMNRGKVEPMVMVEPATPAHLYQEYTLRARNLPTVGLVLAPGGLINRSRRTTFGDFALTPGSSRIPVSFGAVGTASRSNENSNAWAQISHAGLEMTLVGIVIQNPADLPQNP